MHKTRRTPTTSSSEAKRFAVAVLLALVAVAAIVIGVYLPVLDVQATSLDDWAFFIGNPLVTHPSWASTWRFFSEVLNPSTVGGYYLPLSMTSLMLDHAMGGQGTDLRVFHRTNLILHALVSMLAAFLLFRLFGSPWAGALAALLFGLHPLTVEPVAWVAERKTLLAAAFGIGSLICFTEHARQGGRRWMTSSIAFYLLALLSKPTVTMLPVLMLLLDWWPLKRLSRRTLIEKWPHFLLSVMSGWTRLLRTPRTADSWRRARDF